MVLARGFARRARNGATVSNVTSHAGNPGRALSVDYEDDVDVSVMDGYDGASCVVTDSQVIDRVTVGQVLRDQIATMGGEQLRWIQDFVSTDAQRRVRGVIRVMRVISDEGIVDFWTGRVLDG